MMTWRRAIGVPVSMASLVPVMPTGGAGQVWCLVVPGDS